MWYIYRVKYNLAIKKNEAMPVATCLDLEMIKLSEVSQAEKGKYHTILLIYGIFKKWYKDPIYKTELELQMKKNMVTKGIRGR